jgi:aldehyde:ferredoxin oxidoreductase
MSGSFNGKILQVDLPTAATWVETPPESFYRTYGGGSAMGAYYLLRETRPGIDPLSPENVLTFFLSPTTGLPISGQSRMTATAKSTISGGIGDSQCGGFFPAKMKHAGYDGIVIHGASPEPVYLWIHDGQGEIRPAAHLWGKITSEPEDLIKAELDDPRVEVLQIGPAGEKLVLLSAIMNMANRANGRTGMAAVMGSKRLKAVVVQGSGRQIKAFDPKALTELNRRGSREIESNADMNGLALYGTAGVVGFQNTIGSFPTRNYSEGQFEQAQALMGEPMADTILKERDTCFACSVRCKRVVETEYDGQHVSPRFGGPEYATLGTFGS